MALSKEEQVELDLSPLDFFFFVYAKGEVVLNKNHKFKVFLERSSYDASIAFFS